MENNSRLIQKDLRHIIIDSSHLKMKSSQLETLAIWRMIQAAEDGFFRWLESFFRYLESVPRYLEVLYGYLQSISRYIDSNSRYIEFNSRYIQSISRQLKIDSLDG